MVKMYKKSNIFGIVGSGKKKNELIIWDEKLEKDIYKYSFKKKILNLELTEDNIVVVCKTTIYVFNLQNFQLVDVIKTGPNPEGLVGVNHNEMKIIVYPSKEDSQGKLTIKNYKSKNYLYFFPAEKKGEFDCFTLSYDGLFLATLEKGSDTIRIYNCSNGKLWYELTIPNGNSNNLTKKCISISPKNDLIIYSHNKGEIAIFSLKRAKMQAKKENIPEDEYNLVIDKEVSNDHGKKWFKKIEKPFIRMLTKSDLEYEFIKIDDKDNKKGFLFIVDSNGKLYKYKLDLDKKEDSLDVCYSLFEN